MALPVASSTGKVGPNHKKYIDTFLTNDKHVTIHDTQCNIFFIVWLEYVEFHSLETSFVTRQTLF